MADGAVMAAHLGRLLDALNGSEEITAWLNTAVSVPFLEVANRAVPPMGERVRCRRREQDGWEFIWAWGPVIGDVDDVDGAAAAVTTALRSLREEPAGEADG